MDRTRFAAVATGVIIAVSSFIAGGFLYLKTHTVYAPQQAPYCCRTTSVELSPQVSTPSASAKEVTEPSSNSGTTTWPTYTNNEYGFQVEYPPNWHFESTSTMTGYDFLFGVSQTGPEQLLGAESGGGEDDGVDFTMMATSSFDPGVSNWISPKGYPLPAAFNYAGFIGNENIVEGASFELIFAYKVLPSGKVLLIRWSRSGQGDPGNTFSYEQYLSPMLSSLQIL